MNLFAKILTNKKVGIGLLFLGLLPSWLHATPQSKNEGFAMENLKVGVDFGFGMPYAWLLKDEINKEVKLNNKKIEIKAKPNLNLGLTLGYPLLITDNWKIGPELGLNYGFTRKIEIPTFNIQVEESYFQIPLGVKIVRYHDEDFYWASGWNLGYELDILLSSQYKQSGNYPDLKNTELQGDKDLKKDVADLSKLSGSIFVGSSLDLPKGFYLFTRIKVPVELFTTQLKDNKGSEQSKITSDWISVLRMVNSSLAEITLGLDIMKLLND